MDGFSLIAHRGASKHAPENTLSAFELARKKGAQVIECDIAFSKDHIPYIIHDDELNRTTNGRGLVGQKNWMELASLDAGSWFSEAYRGEKLLSLQALLAWQRQYSDIKLNLEIKSMHPKNIPDLLQIILQMIQPEANIIFSSFQVAIIQYLKNVDSNFPRALLVERWSLHAVYLAKSLGCEQLNIGNRFVRKSHIQKTHAAQLKLGVYTVNSKRRFKALKAKGVDAVFTDNCDIDLKLT